MKAVCRACVGVESPRLLCRSCLEHRAVIGFEYRSPTTVGGWPLVHVCAGVDAATGRPRVAKGIVAIGSVAVGAISMGGVAFGLVSFGGLAVGLLLAIGGAAAGLGLSLGGLAIGSVAIGGAAVGFHLAVGGGAAGPSVIDATRCDPAAAEKVGQWLGKGALPPHCPR
jgi:hypothetical protein